MYDVAVIGAGPGGYVAALRAAMRGAKTCCIEQSQLGGACLNVGCIPTKAMLHASELFWQMRHADKFGLSAENFRVDAAVFVARSAKIVEGLRNGVSLLLKKRGVEVIEGRARLVANNTISVDKGDGARQIKAKSIIVASGARPVRPQSMPWDSGLVMTTDEATTASGLPESILILGGGVIGCEFATIYSELGISTTLVEMLHSLVASMDADVSKAVTAGLRQRGVNIVTGTKLEKVSAGKAGVVGELTNGQRVEAEKILVAVGRKPNVDNLGLEELGIKVENGVIRVDGSCRTDVESIYAVGDVAETRQYAHLASRMGIVAADNATGRSTTDDHSVVPVGIYTHPEVACVGLTEQRAREKQKDISVARFPYVASGMAQAYGDTQGMVKIIAEKELGAFVGAVVIGPRAIEVIQEITLAMRSELTVEEIAETIHPHPSFVEAIAEAAEAWMGLPLHTLR
jgi:dihydrolipoamide dehydrogenase